MSHVSTIDAKLDTKADSEAVAVLDQQLQKLEEKVNQIGKSDHVVLSWTTMVEPQEELPNNQAKFLFHKGDYIPIKLHLSRINWSQEFDGKDVNNRWLLLEDTLQDMINAYVPLVCPTEKKTTTRILRRRMVKMTKNRNN